MLPIVFSTDHNFVMQTGVCILSLLKSAEVSQYDIYVLINNDVTVEDKTLIERQISFFQGHKISFINVGDIFEGSYEVRNISIASYSRLLIPWLLPHLDKVIYSDVDIIFKTDLANIPAEELSDHLVAGVPALGLQSETGHKYIESLGLNPHFYINAGFIILNCKLLRDENFKEIFISEAKKKYLYQDQDIINLNCSGRILLMNIGFNVTPRYYEIYNKDLLINHNEVSKQNWKKWISGSGCIIHYAGQKPWNTFTYAWREWWNVYSCSIFYNPEFEIEISKKILRPNYGWIRILGFIKRKLLGYMPHFHK